MKEDVTLACSWDYASKICGQIDIFFCLSLFHISYYYLTQMPVSQAVASQICAERTNTRNYNLHRQKLTSMKSAVDNAPPPMYPHLYQKLKKAQLEEERCSEIERDNRTLVKRMTGIMQRGGIDNAATVTKVDSLNKVKRRQELARITAENHSLLKRIQEQPPTYNHLGWEQDRERSEQLCDRICKYPYRPGGGNTNSPGRSPGRSGELPAITDGSR
jgi:hypothetical protein